MAIQNAILTVSYADNQLLFILNGKSFSFDTELGQPVTDPQRDLTPYLNLGDNTLWAIGVNREGPAHFKYQIDFTGGDGAPPIVWDESPDGIGIVHLKPYFIPKV